MRNDDIPGRGARGFRDGLDASRLRRLALHGLAIALAVTFHSFTAHPPWHTALLCALLGLWAVTATVRHVLTPRWTQTAWSVLLVGGGVCAGLSSTDASAPAFVGATGLFLLISAAETPALWIAGALSAGIAGFALAHEAVGGDPRLTVSVLISAVTGFGFGFLARLNALDRRSERGTAERRAEHAVQEERARIARDIHDVLAHSLGGLVIQLDALEAVSVARGADADVVDRVRGARAMAADGLVAAKHAVDALRRLPAGIDAALGEIVTGVRALGMTVDVEVRGEPARVPEPVGEVIASVTVEALTNARKHAPGAPVAVVVTAGRDAALLRVANRLAPPAERPEPGVTGGHGVPGMRERAEIVGGGLTAGAVNGEWIVECRVPYE
ncbi:MULTISPECIES: histidine kinase [Streptomyces]|uniref:histidine kinase n=1 Tax=Streptomyces yunnanensis TaxID=156453 RepID=A0ABY8AMV4_9ACTN|nr:MULTISPECIES: histidine kinase [Streptomyces]AJC61116.1 two-component system sensor kinase [Streptomyces sp. 769]WEB44832.1 histidine kinase [Streptomyces yunnanensis]